MAIDDARFVALHWLVGPFPTHASAGIETPSVERTTNEPIFEDACAERPATMRAGIVDTKETPVQIPKREQAAVRMDSASSPRRQAPDVGDGDEFAHESEGGASFGMLSGWFGADSLSPIGGEGWGEGAGGAGGVGAGASTGFFFFHGMSGSF